MTRKVACSMFHIPVLKNVWSPVWCRSHSFIDPTPGHWIKHVAHKGLKIWSACNHTRRIISVISTDITINALYHDFFHIRAEQEIIGIHATRYESFLKCPESHGLLVRSISKTLRRKTHKQIITHICSMKHCGCVMRRQCRKVVVAASITWCGTDRCWQGNLLDEIAKWRWRRSDVYVFKKTEEQIFVEEYDFLYYTT